VILPPPRPADEQHLARLVSGLGAAKRDFDRVMATVSAVSRLPVALVQESTETLGQLLNDLQCLSVQEQALITSHSQLADEQATLASDLRALAAANTCPTCGAPLDADRLLAHATAHGGSEDG
jgi:hypothetical protein